MFEAILFFSSRCWSFVGSWCNLFLHRAESIPLTSDLLTNISLPFQKVISAGTFVSHHIVFSFCFVFGLLWYGFIEAQVNCSNCRR